MKPAAVDCGAQAVLVAVDQSTGAVVHRPAGGLADQSQMVVRVARRQTVAACPRQERRSRSVNAPPAEIEWDSASCSVAAHRCPGSRRRFCRSSPAALVVDRTGLTGAYDIDLKWTPTPSQLPPGPPPPGVEPPQIDPNGPSLETALQEQLGLKLDAERGPVEVLVIEKLVPPTEN
jgi:uncharacterized protein (TIGR03435 family)